MYLKTQLITNPLDTGFFLLLLALQSRVRLGVSGSVAVCKRRRFPRLAHLASILHQDKNGIASAPTCLALNLAFPSFFGALSSSFAT